MAVARGLDGRHIVLLSNGVTAFDSEGQPFDPMVHEAMSVIDGDDGSESGTVYAEERRGYLMDGSCCGRRRIVVLEVRLRGFDPWTNRHKNRRKGVGIEKE